MTAKQVLYYLLRHIESKANGYEFTYIPEFETPNARRIDLMVVSNWASHAWKRTAYEIKVSRSDFLNELKSGSKTETMLMYASAAYFVTPKGLITLEELPAGCGLIEVTPQGCSYKRKAPASPYEENTDKVLLMNLMVQAGRRKVGVDTLLATGGDSETLTLEHLRKAKSDGYTEGYKKGQESERDLHKRASGEKLWKILRQVREVIGSEHGWGAADELKPEEIAALMALKDCSPDAFRKYREKVARQAKSLIESIGYLTE